MSKRYNYSTTGYGVFHDMGKVYASGRIEVYDIESENGYAVDEGTYWIPIENEDDLRNFFDNLETDFPININIGDLSNCEKAVKDE